eukprot:3077139-Pyramimonas_sp.AAC.1
MLQECKELAFEVFVWATIQQQRQRQSEESVGGQGEAAGAVESEGVCSEAPAVAAEGCSYTLCVSTTAVDAEAAGSA